MKIERVAVFGANGRMGKSVVEAIKADPSLELHAEISSEQERGLAAGADIAIDFTNRESAIANAQWAISVGMPIVIGTSGLNDDDLKDLEARSSSSGGGSVLVVSNFSLSAFLATKFASFIANDYFQVEIVEYYGSAKKDSPSATSLAIARSIAGARDEPFPSDETVSRSRGETVGGIPIHALRLDGHLSREDIIFGIPGETMTISFETTNREAYMSNVVRALKSVSTFEGLTVGLDKVVLGDHSSATLI